jgi:hypothetical protein
MGDVRDMVGSRIADGTVPKWVAGWRRVGRRTAMTALRKTN